MATFHNFWISIILAVSLITPHSFFSKSQGAMQKYEFLDTSGVGPPNWSSISYKDTIKFANNTSKETGIRPEYLVAILSQESSQGTDLGSCFLFDPKLFGKGVGVDFRKGVFTTRLMKPTRDVEPFLSIMHDLGRDPFYTPVSCPMKIGFGGAMGPMQILPSTWVLVKERAAIALGKRIVDPWIPEDAFMAAAIHLKDMGAEHGTIADERRAACRYFSGKSCGKNKSFIARYGDSIVKKTYYFQKILRPGSLVAKSAPKHKAISKAKHKAGLKKKKKLHQSVKRSVQKHKTK